MEAQEEGRAVPLGVRPAAPDHDVRAAPDHEVPAAGSGHHHRDDRRPSPPRRAHWGVLECIWRYARGLPHTIGRVLQLLLRRRSSGAAGDHVAVIERAGDDVVAKGQRNGSPQQHKVKNHHARMYANRRPSGGKQARHEDRKQARRKDRKQARREDPASVHPMQPRSPAPPESPKSPGSPLMVGDEIVWGEELCQFALYCQESLTCAKNQVLCHRCIFEPTVKKRTKWPPSGMILHCCQTHTTPRFWCRRSGCMVQVGTLRELSLHIHFCHELHTGWWEEKFYQRKMKKD